MSQQNDDPYAVAESIRAGSPLANEVLTKVDSEETGAEGLKLVIRSYWGMVAALASWLLLLSRFRLSLFGPPSPTIAELIILSILMLCGMTQVRGLWQCRTMSAGPGNFARIATFVAALQPFVAMQVILVFDPVWNLGVMLMWSYAGALFLLLHLREVAQQRQWDHSVSLVHKNFVLTVLAGILSAVLAIFFDSEDVTDFGAFLVYFAISSIFVAAYYGYTLGEFRRSWLDEVPGIPAPDTAADKDDVK